VDQSPTPSSKFISQQPCTGMFQSNIFGKVSLAPQTHLALLHKRQQCPLFLPNIYVCIFIFIAHKAFRISIKKVFLRQSIIITATQEKVNATPYHATPCTGYAPQRSDQDISISSFSSTSLPSGCVWLLEMLPFLATPPKPKREPPRPPTYSNSSPTERIN